jgi:hypothetical protein
LSLSDANCCSEHPQTSSPSPTVSFRHHHSLPVTGHHRNSQRPSPSRVTTAYITTSKTDKKTQM